MTIKSLLCDFLASVDQSREAVADAAHGLDIVSAAEGLELSAQAPDDHIDGTFVDFTAVTPHPVKQLRTWINPLRMGNKKLHEAEGSRAQHHRAIV